MYSIVINTLEGISLSLFRNNNLIGSIDKSKVEVVAADSIIPFLQDILKENNVTLKDLKFFSVLVGPGYFTGIRIGIVVAKILQNALLIPCIPINSLLAMAYQQVINSSLPYDYIFSCCDIGKSGAVIGVYNRSLENIIEAKYYENTKENHELEDESFNKLLSNNGKLVIIGNKQSFCYDYLSSINNRMFNNKFNLNDITLQQSIVTPGNNFVNLLAWDFYQENKSLRDIRAFYGKYFDAIKAKAK